MSALAVLVVDDEEALARQLSAGLMALGHVVLTAHSAGEAMQILNGREDIGVVVSDIRMPGEDGLALALRIQASRGEEHAAEIVLITGHATIEDAAGAAYARVSGFLRKPFRLAEARDAVDTAMAQATRRRGSALAREDTA